MEKTFNKIGIQIPEGYRPYRFIVEGQLLQIYLERVKDVWEIHEVEFITIKEK